MREIRPSGSEGGVTFQPPSLPLSTRTVDSPPAQFWCRSVQTTLDIDETLLRQLEQQARRQGKPFGALVEQALRGLVASPRGQVAPAAPNELGEGLPDDDPFFSALEEVRALGRVAVSCRQVNLQ